MNDTKDFEIIASFEAFPPKLDFGSASIPHITCSPDDASWSVDLPEATYSKNDPVDITLKEDQSSPHASLFDLSSNKLTLK